MRPNLSTWRRDQEVSVPHPHCLYMRKMAEKRLKERRFCSFLAELSGQLLNRLPHESLRYDIRLLDLSVGVPEESGVGRAFHAHHTMKLAAQSLPAPRGLSLEAEQLLLERFFFHCRIMYPFVQVFGGMQLLSHIIFHAMHNVNTIFSRNEGSC